MTKNDSPRGRLLASVYVKLSQNDIETLVNDYVQELVDKINYDQLNPAEGVTHKVSYRLGMERAVELLKEEIY